MKKFKILNLYACLGGNRYKWDEVGIEANLNLEITAVEIDEELAKLYQERFPNDKIVIADAHQYLIENYKKFDFIWSSPPCPSHSKSRFANASSDKTKTKPIYPDLKLYEEIIFLQHYYTNGKYVVENVYPFYEPLIAGKKRGRHIYWTNFNIPNEIGRLSPMMETKGDMPRWCEFHEYDFYKYKGSQRTQKIARNLVDYEAGRTILEIALGIIRKSNPKQLDLF